ncbi:MAG: HAD hydrolase-like protein [Rhodospirillales bacterium]|nr:HAD hydrolase-like protein [Rhodospirillales bacterium]
MTVRAALFDLDGTLVASGAGIAAAVRGAMATLGHPIEPDGDLSWAVGPPLADVFLRLLTPLGQESRLQQAMALYRGAYHEGAVYEAPLFPGIVPALAAFRAAGWTLFVATSKPQTVAQRILAHHALTAPFRCIYGAIDDVTLAHKPELLGHIVRNESLDPRRAVMIGDRSFDIAGAHANGLRAVGVLWGYGGAAELEQAGADAIAGNPAELLERATDLVQSGSA